ncbi:hypothetical protein PAAG_11746 [Paracoccidioides lutzii Pb01]|uniref:Uncharacterized protein n=1 Tax=Paracoccidioides lutzii (strain ATCC MYA-826 / Pb01) TaxID=502779 RepID=A0A0A2V119_PARBA|nr:hypothetical protein PAAG_11746 [Paracoccidioides lutzii Pb01]KGQ01511.1 hypothetical protein PAAG_11746 [Paracoccidioides lutzii Pb01]
MTTPPHPPSSFCQNQESIYPDQYPTNIPIMDEQEADGDEGDDDDTAQENTEPRPLQQISSQT